MDIFDKCYAYNEAKEAIKSGNYPYFIPLSSNDGPVSMYHGRKIIMCGSNNYLGLTTHPEVRQAAIDAVQHFGTSCTGSRLLNGTLDLHIQLEKELAVWVRKPAALVFSTGMQTNLGTISAVVGRNDVVILDKDDHASLVDGAKLSGGEIVRFPHNDVDSPGRNSTGNSRKDRQIGRRRWHFQYGGGNRSPSGYRQNMQKIRRAA